jgi:hypothetical protein
MEARMEAASGGAAGTAPHEPVAEFAQERRISGGPQ